ncbi:hypothetical protein C2845_PM09G01860 [Panicum miliaceum]|uniref:DUF1618 domain-containing protein n=1 Tax=Panicum miliaceum TaxID=4540 RepID=A0A3L6RYI6_PANMI|nr:hypothetical protein C2845_PM09G01860 [Panicum miliaceum]
MADSGWVHCNLYTALSLPTPRQTYLQEETALLNLSGSEQALLLLEPSESLRDPMALCFFPSKVIPLQGSLLGWVDLWRGILLCDVLSDNPKLHYIPMPTPMPANEGLEDDGEPTYYRDVTSCGDLIKIVEVEYKYGDRMQAGAGCGRQQSRRAPR